MLLKVLQNLFKMSFIETKKFSAVTTECSSKLSASPPVKKTHKSEYFLFQNTLKSNQLNGVFLDVLYSIH